MRMYDLIMKKRNGNSLTKEEIDYMVQGYTNGSIPDYQMSAMLMAIYFQGMNEEETLNLTMSMAYSGDLLDLSPLNAIMVDKHSTGGVGDKTSIALTAMVAACGVKVAKMSGRGLGHTGGTIDKLESFEGFSTQLSNEQFMQNLKNIGIAITGQSKDLAPADKKMYALRDVTATVDNLSLIAASIMSKKIASGANAVVLDVTTGSGAFMKKTEDAFALAREMVSLGKNAGRDTQAIISNMDQPLGYAVGNTLEVKEAIETLKGNGPEDFTELCITLGKYMLICGGITEDEKEAEQMLQKTIDDGSALDKLALLIETQGGNKEMVYHPELLPTADIRDTFFAEQEGYIQKIICDEIGICAMLLGGGRETMESVIDLSVGIVLKKKVGAYVTKGEEIADLYANDPAKLTQAKERLKKAYIIGSEKVKEQPVILGIVKME